MDIERLYRMHIMIENERTGIPEKFAKDFNIQKRQLYNLLEELWLCGASIAYCRKQKTFFYTQPFDFFDKSGYDLLFRPTNKKVLVELLKDYLTKRTEVSDG